jgi:hypothetical protein
MHTHTYLCASTCTQSHTDRHIERHTLTHVYTHPYTHRERERVGGLGRQRERRVKDLGNGFTRQSRDDFSTRVIIFRQWLSKTYLQVLCGSGVCSVIPAIHRI